jgi:hypothetical protein
MRGGKMPDAFTRRMRVINLLSALVLRKIDPALIKPFDVLDLHHVLNRQISADAIIDQLENRALADALTTGDLRGLWAEALK